MATDIIAIDSGKETNTISMVCSTTPTGFSAKKIVVDDAPVDQQIENIESKFDEKFDDPTYYFDDGNDGINTNSIIVGG
jgi:hypothetical protein